MEKMTKEMEKKMDAIYKAQSCDEILLRLSEAIEQRDIDMKMQAYLAEKHRQIGGAYVNA